MWVRGQALDVSTWLLRRVRQLRWPVDLRTLENCEHEHEEYC